MDVFFSLLPADNKNNRCSFDDFFLLPFSCHPWNKKNKNTGLETNPDIFTTRIMFYTTVKRKNRPLECFNRKSASCYRTVAQRAEVVFADLVLQRAVFTHAAHPELVLLDRQTGHDAHGQFAFWPKSKKNKKKQINKKKQKKKQRKLWSKNRGRK